MLYTKTIISKVTRDIFMKLTTKLGIV